MNELDLYKFCQDKEMDWREDELVIWVSFDEVHTFTEMIGDNYISDGGIESNLQMHNIAFDLVPICGYFGIDPERICSKE